MASPLAEARKLADGEHAAPAYEYQRATLAVLLAIHDQLAAQQATQPPVAQAKPRRR